MRVDDGRRLDHAMLAALRIPVVGRAAGARGGIDVLMAACGRRRAAPPGRRRQALRVRRPRAVHVRHAHGCDPESTKRRGGDPEPCARAVCRIFADAQELTAQREALAACRAGGIFVVTTLDQLACSLPDGCAAGLLYRLINVRF